MWKNWKIKTNNKENCQIFQKKWEYNEAVYRLFIDLRRAYDSFRREHLYNILIQFGIEKQKLRPMQIVRVKLVCRFRAGKHLCDMVPVNNGLKQGDAISPLLFNFVLNKPLRRFRQNRMDRN